MSFIPNKSQRWLFTLAAVLLIALVPVMSAAKNPKLRVTVGQSVTHKVAQNVKTVSIADSDVADVVVAGPREVLINGKDIGLTTLVIWDQNNQSSIYDVVVRGPFSDQKIELRVKVAEVNRTKATELGFDFLLDYTDGGDLYTGGLFGGSISTPSTPLSIFGGVPTEEASAIFRWVSGADDFQTMVHAAMTDGVIRVLAEPNVVAASGQEASFLSGGEIPVPIASSGAQGGTTITIEWKEFGVSVDFIPTIVDSNVVNLHVAPEVSSLDFSNGIEISGFKIPAIRARRAETTVELKNQETLVIGGLIMEEETDTRTKIPLLGHIPILGYLFSDWKKSTTESELVLVVTPHIVRALPPGTPVRLPGVTEENEEN
ncbi:MAG: pilus assembly protein N-terminal domain-containing protein [Candidatus Latescibacterota bacterium]|nr:MAG: pilus assembly protein N-terminal domain-containing protein [Candidatus Latescibacterota bacterium]